MNDPRRHHYNPEFYLGEWAGADDLVCEIKKAYGKVEARRKSPKASGFEHDLYRTVGVPDEQHVEKNFMSRLASNFLMETIANKRVGPTIFDMHWTRHVLKNSKFQLLTSDRPIIMPLGLGNPRAYIVLPVSPTVVFVAAHDRGFAGWLATRKHTELAKMFNKAVVCQARKFVWATDDSQLEFVHRHIGTAPDRTIITEAQKQEALAAARGELSQGT
jgi:Protein of unknown function (DUF4238)